MRFLDRVKVTPLGLPGPPLTSLLPYDLLSWILFPLFIQGSPLGVRLE
jgi:hypothetical protein